MKTIALFSVVILLIVSNIPHIPAHIENEYDYIIITTNTIIEESQKLDDFIQHKESLGFHVMVVTEDDFDHLEGAYPNKRPDKIRQWLIENYQSMGIRYVLLIGDPTPDTKYRGEGEDIQPYITEYNIPMKTFNRRFETSLLFPPKIGEFPSDYYYADLDKDWNPITKDFCADFFDFLYDFFTTDISHEPEVFVGRFPLYNNSIIVLDEIIQKTIDYETSQNNDWRTNTFFAASYFRQTWDGAPACEQIIDDLIKPANFSYYRMYMQGSAFEHLDSEYDSEEELRNGSVVNNWKDNHYGIVSLFGHGSYDVISVGCGLTKDGYMITLNQTALLNDEYPSLVILESCDTGFPERINLGYGLLKNGAIGVYCSSRLCSGIYDEKYGHFDSSYSASGMVYRIVDKVISGQSIGESLYNAKAEIWDFVNIDYYDNLLQFNLYGDPSIVL